MKSKFPGGLCALAAVALLSGCAAPRTNGAVVPVANGNYQSVIKRGDRAAAMQAFDDDAKSTCGKPNPIRFLAVEGKYMVVSQNGTGKAAKEVKSGDQRIDAAIALRFPGAGTPESYELTTVFKCEPLPN